MTLAAPFRKIEIALWARNKKIERTAAVAFRFKANLGSFSTLCAGAAKWLQMPTPESRVDQILYLKCHKQAALRIGQKLNINGLNLPSVSFCNPGFTGWVDDQLDLLAGSFGSSDRFNRWLFGAKGRKNAPDACMVITYGHVLGKELSAELDDPKNAQLIRFTGAQGGWIDDFANLGLSTAESYRILSGHELGHWIWKTEKFGQLLRPAIEEAAPHLSCLFDLLQDARKLNQAKDLAGLPEHCDAHELIRVFLEEMTCGAEESLCDCIGAVASKEPLRCADAIAQSRKKDEPTAAARYTCRTSAVEEQTKELAKKPSKSALRETALVCIRAAAASMHSWLAAPTPGAQTAQCAMLALIAAASGAEPADAKALAAAQKHFDCDEAIPEGTLKLAAAVWAETAQLAEQAGHKRCAIRYTGLFPKKPAPYRPILKFKS